MSNEPVPTRLRSREEAIKEWVLIPLIEAYESIKGDITSSMHENKITWKIVCGLRHKSSISDIYSKHLIDISCRSKEEGSDEDTITEPDIKFFSQGYFRLWIEAKRIYANGPVSEYCDEKGLGRFLSGYYSNEENNGGMIAYIQEGCMLDIREDIIRRVKNRNCIELTEDSGIDDSFMSLHKRDSNRDIKIYHLLFDFVKKDN